MIIMVSDRDPLQCVVTKLVTEATPLRPSTTITPRRIYGVYISSRTGLRQTGRND